MKIKLNKTSIDKLSPGDKEYRAYFLGYTGFGIKVAVSGRKTYFMDFRMQGQARQRVSLSKSDGLSVEDVKKLHGVYAGKIASGINPVEERKIEKDSTDMMTVAEWVEEYKKIVAPGRREMAATVRYLGRLVDELGPVKIDEVTRSQIMSAYSREVERGHTTANRWSSDVCACLNVAAEHGFIAGNPAARIKRLPEAPRERVLSEDEMKLLWKSLEKEDPFIYTAFAVMIHTGARVGEILKADWGEFDLDGGWWAIPNAHSKNKKTQTIPINDKAVAALRALGPGDADTPVIKAITRRRDGDKHRRSLYSAWDRIRDRVGLPDDIIIHDIRRTFGLRICLSSGIYIASKLLRHSSIKITERAYAPLGVEVKGNEALRDAIES